MALDIDMSKVIPVSKRQMQSQFRPTEKLPFGREVSEHMFLMYYSADRGWHAAQIVPIGPLEIADKDNPGKEKFRVMPNSVVLHYAQSIFEGAKAFMHPSGELHTFLLSHAK